MKIKFEWEEVKIIDTKSGMDIVRRARVINGWLIKSFVAAGAALSESTVFIPDPNHEWEIER